MEQPINPVSLQQAARILGTSKSSVHRLVLAGRLPRHGDRYGHRTLALEDVEALAVEVYDWWKHQHDATSYWVVGKDAAAVMGVSAARVRKLAAEDRLPHVVHRDGVRLYRRTQLEVLAHR